MLKWAVASIRKWREAVIVRAQPAANHSNSKARKSQANADQSGTRYP